MMIRIEFPSDAMKDVPRSANPVEIVMTFLTSLFLSSGRKAAIVFATPTTLTEN